MVNTDGRLRKFYMTIKGLHGVSAAARALLCTENTVRALDKRGVIRPQRDSAGRRQLTDEDLTLARVYLARRRQGTAA